MASLRPAFQLAAFCAAVAAADDRCASCHPAEVKQYLRSGMWRSIGPAVAHAAGSFTRAGVRISIRTAADGMTHAVGSDERRIRYFIGSGSKGHSYLLDIKGRLFQSPVSYYSERARYDLSPGFENDQTLAFDRPVTPECLFCHAGPQLHVRGTLNTFDRFRPHGITCDRCHGDVSAHAAKPSRANIVQPGRLEQRARDSVCEQCHLGGEARILNPGTSFSDFAPGQPLERTFSVYISAGDSRQIRVVSHVEQLAKSTCAMQSGGRLWCGTCHNPHREPAYREACTGCHAPSHLTSHKAPLRNCIECHMPKSAARDVPHAAYTDHRIVRRPASHTVTESPRKLVAWVEPAPALRDRNLGLAYISAGERESSTGMMQEGFRLLVGVQQRFNRDPAVLTALAQVLLRKGRHEEAAKLFRAVVVIDSGEATYHLNLAAALAQSDPNAALTAIDRALAIDPSLADAYVLGAMLHRDMHREKEARELAARYRRFWQE